MNDPLIIVGAGLAAWTTVRELRKLDSERPVIMITRDAGHFYAKPTLSNAQAQRKGPDDLVTTPAADMVARLKLSLLHHTEVLGIDRAARRVRTRVGDFTYSQLVLAQGAEPIRLPLKGTAADQVQAINHLQDYAQWHQRLQHKPASRTRLLIMGAGLIGCEFANDLADAGYQVTVVDPSAAPMPALLPAPVGQALAQALQGRGVRFRWGRTVQWVDHTEEASAATRAPLIATLSDGERIEADAVLSAVGLRPNITLALSAGLATDRGIRVDAWLRTSDPDIFAIGDNAQYASAGDRTLPYVMPIMSAARQLAQTLAARDAVPPALLFPVMPVVVKTPALPLVVAPPAPQADGRAPQGQWLAVAPGIWHFERSDAPGAPAGFILLGEQTRERAAQTQRLAQA